MVGREEKEQRFLTAEEAREFDPARILRKYIKETEQDIVNAAKRGKHEVRVDHKILTDLCDSDGGGGFIIDKGKAAEFFAHFTTHGFNVRTFYEARQFVDAGVIISWKE